MKTQGISLVTAGVPGSAPSKSTKAKGSIFDSFIANSASGVASRKTGNSDSPSETVSEAGQVSASKQTVKKVNAGEKTAKNELANKSGAEKGTASLQTNASDMQPVAVVEMPVVEDVAVVLNLPVLAEQIMSTLQEIFGMSGEEIQDVMKDMGIEVSDLILDLQDDRMQPATLEVLQSFVMEIHGITDKAAFLTNDGLNQELTELTDMAENILTDVADAIGIPIEKLEEDGAEIMMSFGEQLDVAVQETVGQQASAVQQTIAAQNPADNQQQEAVEDVVVADASEGFEVIVEEQTGSETESGDDGRESETAETKQPAAVRKTTPNRGAATAAAELFTERLTQAFRPGTEETAGPARVMTQIVEQVLRQVRIRVMPETTNMELQLHPASLGRVNLQVSSTGGVATALLTVENQAAKDALESQMIALKQSFEEQGLKVDAVEVTVSEFGLKKENEQTGQEQPGSKNGNRRFREDAGTDADESDADVAAGVTEATRRDANSVVDYTA